jgi:putative heme-binding domain-containing protein
VLRGPTDVAIARGLLERWRGIHPGLKRDVTTLLLGRRDYHAPLLDAVESGRVTLGELNLDLEDRRRLISWSSTEIKERARKLIGDGEYGNRQAKVEEWLAKLPPSGDAANGRAVFEKACAQCHVVGTLGHEVGPNLTGQSHRSIEDLVSNILDPNMAINPNYLSVSVETKDGELLTGILAAETPAEITLLQAQGLRSTLRRDRIGRQESAGTSLMPEGLEAGLSPQDLRNLVAFLQTAK